MRLDVHDPDFKSVIKLWTVKVLLNGKDVTMRCTWADEDRGEVMLLKEPVMYDTSKAAGFMTDTHRGKVKILLGRKADVGAS